MDIGIEDLRFTIYEGAGTHFRRNSEKCLPRGSVGAIPARGVSPHPDPLPKVGGRGEGKETTAPDRADVLPLASGQCPHGYMALHHSRFSSFRVLESATCAGVL